MPSFLENLPSANPSNFSEGAVIKDEPLLQIVDVPLRAAERKIQNEKKPLLLRYLEKNYHLREEQRQGEEAGSSGSRGIKRRDSDDAVERNSKSRRLSGPGRS